mgnify:CR=1 FL=1
MKSHRHRRRLTPAWATARIVVVLVVGIVVLLGLGRLLVHVAPVTVEIEGEGNDLRITVDGTSRHVALPRPIVLVRPVAPISYRREHQIDGSDSTNLLNFDPRYFAEIGGSPYYRFQALLREEWRYSIWRNLVVADRSGRVVIRQDSPPDGVEIVMPGSFLMSIDLERPEIPRALDLVDDNNVPYTLEVNRNDKLVRLGRHRARDEQDLTNWYFPREVLPPLATLVDLLTRVGALALGLVLVGGLLGLAMPAVVTWRPGLRTLRVGVVLGLAFFGAASWYVATALFDRAPHILDAVAYTFQARTFAMGDLWVRAPFVEDAFPIPFSVLSRGRWFAQYPPGTAALLAVGYWLRLPWLVEPVLAAGSVLLLALATRRQYGPGTALLVVLLLVTSPFLLLIAGSFLSHVPALFFVCVALYAAVCYVERPRAWLAGGIAMALGLALLTRELVGVLYGFALLAPVMWHGIRLRGRRFWVDALTAGLVALGAVGLYLGYNAALTGQPFLLPRMLFNSADVLGFGKGIGFYGEHTLASGLVNMEQQLVSLGFYLAGWPYGFSLAVMVLPLVTRRLGDWDGTYLSVAGLFVVVYVAEFYHGIAFGPRYYFEALPAFVVLTVRGLTALTESVAGWLESVGRSGAWFRARLATGIVLAALLACNALYFLPREAELYRAYSGLPGGGPKLDGNIGYDSAGRVSLLPPGSLVVSDDWWEHMMFFASLNCPTLDCPTLFALATDETTRVLLRRTYPDRRWYNAVERNGVLTIVPAE